MKSPAKILVVEDSSVDRALIRATLGHEERQFTFEEADSAEGALAKLARQEFDLLIVDHRLSGGTGLEVLEGLKKLGRTTPAIYLTAELSRSVVAAALALGASHYLAKDASYAHLLGPVVSRSLELEVVRRERAEAMQQLAQAEAVARVRTEFLQKVTHELRTPLSSILGYTDCLIEGLDGALSTRQVASLERVRRNARRLLAFINDMLDFSALEAREVDPEPETFALAPMLEELAAPVRRRVDHLTLAVACAPRLSVRCDRKLLGRAIGHLLDNAVRFTPEGQVRLEAHADPVAGGLVHVAVTDTGPGIPASLMEQVREPFRQGNEGLDRSHEGLGLGLALVERLARLLQGELEVESAPGAGSTFRLALPILQPDGSTAAASWPPNPAVVVLAIDRDAETHALASKILGRGGIRVTGVLSVSFALALLAEVRPGAILLDLSTAQLEDADVLARFREEARRRGIPTLCIQLTGERLGAGDEAGRPLEKPFHPDELLERVRALVSTAR